MMAKATAFQIFGELPPSVEGALTARQKRALSKYIILKVMQPTYRMAYDLAREADGGKPKRTRRPSPGAADE